jgi:hypothetical protein
MLLQIPEPVLKQGQRRHRGGLGPQHPRPEPYRGKARCQSRFLLSGCESPLRPNEHHHVRIDRSNILDAQACPWREQESC